jgi:hypothetical protein
MLVINQLVLTFPLKQFRIYSELSELGNFISLIKFFNLVLVFISCPKSSGLNIKMFGLSVASTN